MASTKKPGVYLKDAKEPITDGYVKSPRRRPQTEQITARVTDLIAGCAPSHPVNMLRARMGAKGILAGIAMDPSLRFYLDDFMDNLWGTKPVVGGVANPDEVVVGGGLHAAIYCAVRVAQGFPRPLVLEQDERAGGVMAMTRKPAFYLNSRNRPGSLGVPGMDAALNVIPAGAIQPADLSGDEYQRNSDLAYAIRMTLAMNARVATGCQVARIERVGEFAFRYRVTVLRDGETIPINVNRVVLTTGLGKPREFRPGAMGDRVMTYERFMARMDTAFPLKGLRRVAVIGAGDSGKTAVEALLQQGPSGGWTAANLDYVERIDWYGQPSLNCGTFLERERTRYAGIARALPKASGREARVMPKAKATSVARGYECGYVNDIPYDAVIDCTGYEPERVPWAGGSEVDDVFVGGRVVGRRVGQQDILVFGVAANLPLDDEERKMAYAEIRENATALFRYASRTAAAAAAMPAPTPPGLSIPGLAKGKPNRVLRDTATVQKLVSDALAADKDGNELFVGTPVRLIDVGLTGVVAGRVENDSGAIPGFVGVRTFADDGIRRGGFQVEGEQVYGVRAEEVAALPERDAITTDGDGTPLYVGDPVVVTGSSRFDTVKGYVTGMEGERVRIALKRGTASGDEPVPSDDYAYTASRGRVTLENPRPVPVPF